jgi:hypothetical protein
MHAAADQKIGFAAERVFATSKLSMKGVCMMMKTPAYGPGLLTWAADVRAAPVPTAARNSRR